MNTPANPPPTTRASTSRLSAYAPSGKKSVTLLQAIPDRPSHHNKQPMIKGGGTCPSSSSVFKQMSLQLRVRHLNFCSPLGGSDSVIHDSDQLDIRS